MMSVETGKIKKAWLLGIQVHLDVSIPQIAVAYSWPKAPPTCFQRPQKARDDFLDEFLSKLSEPSIVTPAVLCVGEIRSKLASKVLFPGIVPTIIHPAKAR